MEKYRPPSEIAKCKNWIWGQMQSACSSHVGQDICMNRIKSINLRRKPRVAYFIVCFITAMFYRAGVSPTSKNRKNSNSIYFPSCILFISEILCLEEWIPNKNHFIYLLHYLFPILPTHCLCLPYQYLIIIKYYQIIQLQSLHIIPLLYRIIEARVKEM